MSFVIMAALVALAVPASASAGPGDKNSGFDCNYAKTEEASTADAPVPEIANAPVVVYVGTGGPLERTDGDAGLDGSAIVAAGVCADGLGLTAPDGTFDGGAVEAGAGIPAGGPGGYVIVDGNDSNTAGGGQSDGYAGISNYESAPPRGNCDGGDGTNSGGCFEIRDRFTSPEEVPVPIACGNTSGANWNSSGRDGCIVP